MQSDGLSVPVVSFPNPLATGSDIQWLAYLAGEQSLLWPDDFTGALDRYHHIVRPLQPLKTILPVVLIFVFYTCYIECVILICFFLELNEVF